MEKEIKIEKTSPTIAAPNTEPDNASRHLDNLTITQLRKELSPSGKLVLQVIESLDKEEAFTIQKILNLKYPLRISLQRAIENASLAQFPADLNSEDFLFINQAAPLLDLSPITVRVLAQNGRFPGAHKIGRDWQIPAATIWTFQRSQRGRPRKQL